MNKISSQRMGKAVQLDPQFSLPKYPHFPDSFQLIPIEDGVIIHGGESLQYFPGKNVYRFFEHFLPILDGTNSVEDIYRKNPQIKRQMIFNNLALLYSRGLLEDGPLDKEDYREDIDKNILDFFRRHTDSTRYNKSANEGLKRLADENILILSNTTNAKQLHSSLKLFGAENVTQKSIYDIKLCEETFVIVLLSGSIPHDILTKVDDICAAKGIPWLLSSLHGDIGLLGPYFNRKETACYECFASLYSSNQRKSRIEKQTDSFLIEMWTELTTMEVAYILTRLLPHQTGSNFNTYDLTKWTKETRRVPRRPGCKHCLPIKGLSPKIPELAFQYENEINWPSNNLNNPKGHQVHYQANVHMLTHQAKVYPNLEHIKLAPSEELPSMRKPYTPSIFANSSTEALPTKNKLARVLLSGGGWRKHPDEEIPKNEKNQRFSPTGGNLGSVQLYLIAKDIIGLSKQVYYYQPKNHSLQPLGTKSDIENLNDIIHQITELSTTPQFKGMIIMTGAYDRVVFKYGAFGYKVIHLDAGAALAQMQGTSLASGITLQNITQYNEQSITDLLNIDYHKEPITGVLLIN
ncbi:SagB family peptide dehydrogenase [Sediminibacillus sp. JSM 1682029]|uniref:SagB family peptide dehydrogenase n=1 Tax=Sediminibacillus sp. JSM 1682029 TaxID=3229857 RepID=UPI0035258830